MQPALDPARPASGGPGGGTDGNRRSSLTQVKVFGGCALALGRTPSQKWRILWELTRNLRVRFGLGAHRPESVLRLRTRYGDLWLRQNFGDVTNLPDIFYHNVYGIRRLSRPGTIVDVGANIGLFAAWAAHLNPGRKVVCIEPLGANTEMIRRNCPTAEIVCSAVGRERSRIELEVDPDEVMASQISNPRSSERRSFEVLPLDDVLRDRSSEAVAFLKIDAEGMEIDILEGAEETLGRTSEIAMESHGAAMHREALRRLGSAGFAIDHERHAGRTGLIRAQRRA